MMAIQVWRGFWRAVHLGAPFLAIWLFLADQPIAAIIMMMVWIISG